MGESKLSLKGISIEDYFNDWICYFIFLIKYEELKLGFNAKKEYISKYLTFNYFLINLKLSIFAISIKKGCIAIQIIFLLMF